MSTPSLERVTFDFRAARATLAGVSLGLFDALADGPLPAEAVAERCGLALRGARALLDALVALGLVRREGERFANTEAAQQAFTHRGDASRRHVALHDLWHWGLWSRLEDALREGTPVSDRSGDPFFSQPEVLRRFFPNLARAMEETSRRESEALCDVLALRGDERVLDLGGGVGNFLAALAKRHAGLEGEVLDLPPVAAEAREFLSERGLADRIRVRAGDFRSDPLDPTGHGWDVILLSRVLMGLDDGGARALLGRAAGALAPGGRVAVVEFRREEDAPSRVAALLDLDMLLLTGGRVRTPGELAALLRAAGLAPGEPRRVGDHLVLLEGRTEARA